MFVMQVARLSAKVAAVLKSLGVLDASVCGEDALAHLSPLEKGYLDSGGDSESAAADGATAVWRSESILHKLQNDSLVRHMDRLRFRCSCGESTVDKGGGDHRVAIELCAGRGRLSGAMQAAFDCALHPLDLVLVDRAVVKGSGDSSLVSACASPHASVQRVACDLADVNLTELPSVRGGVSSIAVHGKHTCGEAADLALRAVVGLHESRAGDAPLRVGLAMCCHHLCTWEGMYGRGPLDAAGITQDDFDVLRRCATLYRAHPRLSSRYSEQRAQGTAAGRLACARADLGIAAKRMINEARATQLRKDIGGTATVCLVQYVDDTVTPENTLLLAST